jgi:excisionase family DNA binding protein
MNQITQDQPDWRSRTTVTVDEAGAIVGISRASAYQAANSGDLPTVRIGRRLLVPVAQLKRMLGEADGS